MAKKTKLVRQYDIRGNELPPVTIEISEAEAELTELTDECNEEHEKAMKALKNWKNLTPAQKDDLLKLLVKFYLVTGANTGVFQL